MSNAADRSAPCLGFLTVVESEELGVTGGYLVLNKVGRPLEFHCTAPVKVTRTQEILYGPALKPCLYGEQIGLALVEKSREKPVCILTDIIPVLGVRQLVDCPVALVMYQDGLLNDEPAHRHHPCGGQEGASDAQVAWGSSILLAGTHPGWLDVQPFTLGCYRVAVLNWWVADREKLEQVWSQETWLVDLCEPFGRIRQAIGEAQKAAALTTAAGKP